MPRLEGERSGGGLITIILIIVLIIAAIVLLDYFGVFDIIPNFGA
jgi:flagellar basal body-associated protein FliL